MNLIMYGVLFSFIEALKLFLAYWGVVGCRPKRELWRYILCITMIESITTGAIWLSKDSSYVTIISMGVELLVPFLCMDGKVKNKLLYYIPTFFSIAIVDIVLITLVSILLHVSSKLFIDNQDLRIIGNTFIIPILLLCIYCREKRRIQEEYGVNLSNRYYCIIVIVIICSGIILGGTQTILQHSLNLVDSNVYILYVAGFCMLFIGLCIKQIFILRSRDYYKQIDSLNKEYLSMQEKYYQALYEKDKSLRSFRHDFNGHVTCMKELCERKNYQELSEYINNIGMIKERLNHKQYSGNRMIDAVIDDILQDNNNIEINFDGVLPSDSGISLFDLCIIFSNTIRNAVEACQKFDDNEIKIIDVEVNIFKQFLNIHISNPVKETVIIKGENVKTSKSDKDLHGFGLNNIKQAVKKYDGDIKFYNEDGKFVVDILLSNNNISSAVYIK